MKIVITTALSFLLAAPVAAFPPPPPVGAPPASVRAAETPGAAVASETTLQAAGRGLDGFGYGEPGVFAALFPRTADGAFAVAAKGVSAVVRMTEVAPVAAEVVPGRVAYRGVLPGVDAYHRLDASRAEEFLLVRDATAPTTFSYTLELSEGARVEALASGGVRLSGPAGVDAGALEIEPPYTIDARGARSESAARYELDAAGDGFATLRLVVDPTGLALPYAVDPTWVATGGLVTGRSRHRSAVLSSGQVLVAGGDISSLSPTGTAKSETYDPSTGVWTAAGNMSRTREIFTLTPLNSGRVLAVGGFTSTTDADTTCETYNPTTRTWAAAASMATGRAGHSAAKLSDGRVLVAGGLGHSTSTAMTTATAEVYNPTTNAWSSAGSLATSRYFASAVRLDDGRVLVAGGVHYDAFGSPTTLASCEIYNPSTNTWSAGPSLAQARSEFTLTKLTDGRVLAAGGGGAGYVGTAELYNPTTNAWSSAGSHTPRALHAAERLSNGKVMISGGNGAGTTALATCEIYDPATNAWTASDTLNKPRNGHTMDRLSDGRLLVVGGYNVTNGYLKSCEIR